MLTWIGICLGVLAVVHTVALVFWIVTLIQMRRAAQAVEALSYRVSNQVQQVGLATEKALNFADAFPSKWLKTLTTGLSFAASLFPAQPDPEKNKKPEDGGGAHGG